MFLKLAECFKHYNVKKSNVRQGNRIYRSFFMDDAITPINLEEHTRTQVVKGWLEQEGQVTGRTGPATGATAMRVDSNVFTPAFNEILLMLESDSFARFKSTL